MRVYVVLNGDYSERHIVIALGAAHAKKIAIDKRAEHKARESGIV